MMVLFQVGRGGAVANNDAQQVHQHNVGLYNWQATKMTVKERLGFLFNSNILSDVTFVVGRGSQVQRIPAHKFVLSVGSAVFDAMFNSTLATQEEEIELPDVEVGGVDTNDPVQTRLLRSICLLGCFFPGSASIPVL